MEGGENGTENGGAGGDNRGLLGGRAQRSRGVCRRASSTAGYTGGLDVRKSHGTGTVKPSQPPGCLRNPGDQRSPGGAGPVRVLSASPRNGWQNAEDDQIGRASCRERV